MVKEKKNKIDSIIEYGLKKIQILKFNLSEINDVNLDLNKIHMSLQIEGDLIDKNGFIKITTSIIVSNAINKSKKKKIAELKVSYLFELNGIENLIDEGNKTYLPKNLINTFNTIAISSSRGILFTKFQGTKIQNFILPLIDPSQFNESVE